MIKKTSIVIILFCLCFRLPNAIALESENSCNNKEFQTFSDLESRGVHISNETSIEEIRAKNAKGIDELIEMYKDQLSIEQIQKLKTEKSGKGTKRWQELIKTIQDGDQIREIWSRGGTGYVIVRDNCVVDVFMITLY